MTLNRYFPQLTFLFIVALQPYASFAQHHTINKTQKSPLLRYSNSIKAESLSNLLHTIASDSFRGRGNGDYGQTMAAGYISSFFAKHNIPALSKTGNEKRRGNYFQEFRLHDGVPLAFTLKFGNREQGVSTTTFSHDATDGKSYFLSGGPTNTKGSVVFAGYGIEADSLRFTEYSALKDAGISVSNKWLMILDGEPAAVDGRSLLPTSSGQPSAWSRGVALKQMAIHQTSEQPLGILVVYDSVQQNGSSFATTARTLAKSLPTWHQYSPLDPSKHLPQTYAVSKEMANELLAGSGHSVDELKRSIAANLKPLVFDLKEANVESLVQKKPVVEAKNIFAYIEGSDARLKNEVIVLSAHYDHLGIDTSLKGDQIYNGAADDGSGTAAVLAIAKSVMEAKNSKAGLKRSVLFALFASEEIGHLGSL
jgi:hypothetical protein